MFDLINSITDTFLFVRNVSVSVKCHRWSSSIKNGAFALMSLNEIRGTRMAPGY